MAMVMQQQNNDDRPEQQQARGGRRQTEDACICNGCEYTAVSIKDTEKQDAPPACTLVKFLQALFHASLGLPSLSLSSPCCYLYSSSSVLSSFHQASFIHLSLFLVLTCFMVQGRSLQFMMPLGFCSIQLMDEDLSSSFNFFTELLPDELNVLYSFM